MVKQAINQRARRPVEGVPFDVNPLGIDRNLFKEKREDSQQELTRKLILEAFDKLDKNQKYGKPFKTLMPKNILTPWDHQTVGGLRKIATVLGDHMADWVEQALEWAQRIANGETWEAVCNKPDTANWHRMIMWKNGYSRSVGGSRKCEVSHCKPASKVDSYDFDDGSIISIAVPLVVLYK